MNKLRELQSTETTNISESFISWLILFHLLLCHSYKIRKSLCFHRSKSIVTKLGIMIKYNWSKTKIQMSCQVVQDCGSPLSKIHGLIQLLDSKYKVLPLPRCWYLKEWHMWHLSNKKECFFMFKKCFSRIKLNLDTAEQSQRELRNYLRWENVEQNKI